MLDQLERLASRAATEAGLELVELSLRGSSSRRLLRVDIDRAGPRGADLGDCEQVSRALAKLLDDEDPITSRYVLEVSSPGIDRPIRTADDIRRNTGRRVVVDHAPTGEPERRSRGLLLGCSDGCLRLEGPAGDELRIPLDEVRKARQDIEF